MTEFELRYLISDYEEFRGNLLNVGAKIVKEYKFKDFYYVTKSGKADLLNKTLRVREMVKPKSVPEVLFSKVKYDSYKGVKVKRQVYPQGKIILYKGSMKNCREILEDLGFKYFLTINKEIGQSWFSKKFNIGVGAEYISGLGWVAEIELHGDNFQKLFSLFGQTTELLKIPKSRLTHKPISQIYYETVKRRV